MNSVKNPEEIPSRWRWSPLAIYIAILSVLFPLLSNAFLAPPDSAAYFAVPRTIVLGGDLDFYDEYQAFAFPENQFYVTGTGLLSNDWPMGSGAVWLPAYAAAHLAALKLHPLAPDSPLLEPEGTRGVYRLFVTIWVAIIGGAGLWLGWRLAESLFGPKAATWAILCAFWGTPIAFYYFAYGLMSHITSLAAVGLLFIGWHQTRTERSFRHWAILGAISGVMVMVRPQDISFLSIFLVEIVLEWEKVKSRWQQWLKGVGIAAVTALLAFSPQMMVWGFLYGNPLQLPKIEEMHWFSPNLIPVLFSEYNGLISWSPVILLLLAGFPFLWKKDRVLATGAGVALVLAWYLNAANEIWWAGGSFGNRRFLNCAVPFLIVIAAGFAGIRTVTFRILAVLLTLWTVWLMGAERAGLLNLAHFHPWDRVFFVEKLFPALNPLTFITGMIGDFSGFPWWTRILAMMAGLGVAGWIQFGGVSTEKLIAARQWLLRSTLIYFLAFVPLLVFLAGTRTEQKNYAETHPHFFTRNGSLFDGFYEYGFFLLRKNRQEEALEAYLRAAEFDPRRPQPWRYVATIKMQRGELDEALEASGKALDLDPQYGAAFQIEQQIILHLAETQPLRRRELLTRLASRVEAAGFPDQAREILESI